MHPPPFVDYRVCGTAIATECLGLVTFCDTIRVFFFGNLVANINPDPARFCAAQGGITLTGSATGGLPPYTYTWRNAANVIVDNDSLFTTSTLGTYRLFVGDQLFDPAACNISVDTITVTLDSIHVTETHVNASCNGVCDGSINLTVSSVGGGPYSYVWSDIGPGPEDRTGLCDQTYTVTVTSGGGACVATRTIVISEPATFVVVIDSVKDAGCNGEATGCIWTHTSGGTLPLANITWSNSLTTEDICNLFSGTYTITVTDAHGCTASASAFVDEPAVQVPLITSVNINGNNVSCYGLADDTSCANVTGGTLPYTYLWTPSLLNTQCVTAQGGGVLICVTVTDANGCTGDTCKIITQPDSLWLSVDDISSFICGYQVSCFGATDGFLDITTHGGTAPFCYDWSDIPGTCPVDEGEDRASIGQGTYTVTVTDVNGCTSSISATLNEPAVVYDSIVSPLTPGGYNIQCYGECNGKIYSNVTGGCPPYTFTWTPNVSSSDSAVDLCAGLYMLTVTDVNGCSFTDTLSVTQPDTVLALITVVILNAGNPVSCFGLCDGTAFVTASGGSPPYTYTWNYPPLTVPTFSPAGDTIYSVCAGPLSILVADINGCSASDADAITEPPLLTASVVLGTYSGGWNITCNSVCDGFGTVTPAGGTSPYTYLWCNGDTTATSSATLCAGPCAVTVTDDNGCDTTITFNLTEPPALSVTIADSVRNCNFNISCHDSCDGIITAVPVGGATPVYIYSWSTACSTQTCTGLCVGTYTVTVTDENGCSATASVTLTEPTPLVTAPLTADTCIGGWNICCNAGTNGNVFVTPSGGCIPYTYLWSNGDLDSIADNVSVFIYFVTVTDANGCIAHSDSITLTEPQPLTDTVIPSLFDTVNVHCNGACDGWAVAVPSGGTPPYSYVWSTVPVQNTDTAVGLCAATYMVTITDVNGCSTIDSVTLTEPPVLTTTVTADTVNGGFNVSCNGACDGQATANPGGGSSPYSYSWSTIPVQITQTASGLCATTYTVTVTDINGCTATASVTLTEPPAVTVSLSSTTLSCNVGCTDTITAIPGGGIGPYTYCWTPPGPPCPNGTNTLDSVCIGTYTVTVTDANGCPVTDSITTTGSTLGITITMSGCDYNGWGVSCKGASDGCATATPTSGTGPYTYQWSPPGNQVTQTISNLSAGTYTVTVTDANGCTGTADYTVTEPPQLTVSDSVSLLNPPYNTTCPNAADAWAIATAGGGTAPYTYVWSNGDSAAFADSLAGSITGTVYTVTAYDANGCSASDTILVLTRISQFQLF